MAELYRQRLRREVRQGTYRVHLLAEVKRRYPELPVLMVTAYGDDERRRRAKELGAVEYLSKPIDFDLLRVRLLQLPNAGGSVSASLDRMAAYRLNQSDPSAAANVAKGA